MEAYSNSRNSNFEVLLTQKVIDIWNSVKDVDGSLKSCGDLMEHFCKKTNKTLRDCGTQTSISAEFPMSSCRVSECCENSSQGSLKKDVSNGNCSASLAIVELENTAVASPAEPDAQSCMLVTAGAREDIQPYLQEVCGWQMPQYGSVSSGASTTYSSKVSSPYGSPFPAGAWKGIQQFLAVALQPLFARGHNSLFDLHVIHGNPRDILSNT